MRGRYLTWSQQCGQNRLETSQISLTCVWLRVWCRIARSPRFGAHLLVFADGGNRAVRLGPMYFEACIANHPRPWQAARPG